MGLTGGRCTRTPSAAHVAALHPPDRPAAPPPWSSTTLSTSRARARASGLPLPLQWPRHPCRRALEGPPARPACSRGVGGGAGSQWGGWGALQARDQRGAAPSAPELLPPSPTCSPLRSRSASPPARPRWSAWAPWTPAAGGTWRAGGRRCRCRRATGERRGGGGGGAAKVWPLQLGRSPTPSSCAPACAMLRSAPSGRTRWGWVHVLACMHACGRVATLRRHTRPCRRATCEVEGRRCRLAVRPGAEPGAPIFEVRAFLCVRVWRAGRGGAWTGGSGAEADARAAAACSSSTPATHPPHPPPTLHCPPARHAQVKVEGGATYLGTTPTAPFAKWALAEGRARVPSGLEVRCRPRMYSRVCVWGGGGLWPGGRAGEQPARRRTHTHFSPPSASRACLPPHDPTRPPGVRFHASCSAAAAAAVGQGGGAAARLRACRGCCWRPAPRHEPRALAAGAVIYISSRNSFLQACPATQHPRCPPPHTHTHRCLRTGCSTAPPPRPPPPALAWRRAPRRPS